MSIPSFKDFNIQTDFGLFPGKKIEINDILNLEITVIAFKFDPSKIKPGTTLLTLDIEFENKRRIVWTGSTILKQQIQLVPQSGFPFKTKIVAIDKHLEFT